MSQRRPGALELTNPMSVYHNYYTLMLQKYQNHDMDVEPRHGRQKRGVSGMKLLGISGTIVGSKTGIAVQSVLDAAKQFIPRSRPNISI